MTEREAVDILDSGRGSLSMTIRAGRYILGVLREVQRTNLARDEYIHELIKFKESIQATITTIGKESMADATATQPRQDVHVHGGIQEATE